MLSNRSRALLQIWFSAKIELFRSFFLFLPVLVRNKCSSHSHTHQFTNFAGKAKVGREAGGKSIVFPSFSSYFSPRCATVIKCLYVHFIVVDLCPVVSVELCRARVESIKFVHDDGDYGSAGSVQRVVWVFVMFGGREKGGVFLV